MIENAVEYYFDLKTQGIDNRVALAHTCQRFGLSHTVLGKRIDGYVADPEVTRFALARAKDLIENHVADTPTSEAIVLAWLYESITGERLNVSSKFRNAIPNSQEGEA